MAAGTLMGGWRIVHTMGSKITHLTPQQCFCAETAGAISLFFFTNIGVPVSTTHTITGAIVGVGAARRVSAVRWNIASNIVWAWVITMPVAGLLGAGFFWLARLADRIWGPEHAQEPPARKAGSNREQPDREPRSAVRRTALAAQRRGRRRGAVDHQPRDPSLGDPQGLADQRQESRPSPAAQEAFEESGVQGKGPQAPRGRSTTTTSA